MGKEKEDLDFERDYGIHVYNIINVMLTSLVSVLYINSEDEVTESGIVTWIQYKYGTDLPINISEQEFDRLLIGDSNELSKWKLNYFVVRRLNRLVIYNSKTFHSK